VLPHWSRATLIGFFAVVVLSAASIGGAAGLGPAGSIAFSADNQIFLEQGGRTVQLTHDRPGVVGIAWSPDGSRLLAWRYRKLPAISIVNADGSIGSQVATEVAGEPRWSPDGSRIAFQRGQYHSGQTGRAIYVVDANGHRIRRVTKYALPGAVFGSVFSWSPDGTRIVYAGGSPAGHGLFIARVGAAPSSPTPIPSTLTKDPGLPDDPVWSPNGSAIAYQDGAGGVSLVKPDGTGRKRLPVRFAYGPAWSPDGSKLAFVSRRANYVVNADGTGLKKLPGCRCANVWPGFTQSLTWSPDGSMIAYAGGTGPGRQPESGIYVEKLDGSAAVRIASSPTSQYSRPLWRPKHT